MLVLVMCSIIWCCSIVFSVFGMFWNWLVDSMMWMLIVWLFESIFCSVLYVFV